MNYFRLFFIVFFSFLAFTITNAQLTAHKMVHVGYAYQNQSFGEIGGRVLLLNNDDFIYRIGISGMFGTTDGKFSAMPKLQADFLINTEKNVDFYHSYYFLAGAEVTTKYAAPKMGFTLFGLVDLTAGYAFPLGNSTLQGKQLKGVNINFTINLPIVMLHDLLK